MIDLTDRLRNIAQLLPPSQRLALIEAAQEIELLRMIAKGDTWSAEMETAWRSDHPDRRSAFAAVLRAARRS